MILPPDQIMQAHLPLGERVALYTGAVLGALAIVAGLANAFAYLRGGPRLQKVPGGPRGALSRAILGVLVGSYFVWVSMIYIRPRVRQASIVAQTADLHRYLSANLPDIDPQLFLRYVHVGAVGIDDDIDNGSALSNYLRLGNIAAAQQLLAAGASVDKHPDGALSPLLEAIAEDEPEVVRFLLAVHADPNLAADHLPIFDAVNPDPDPVLPAPDHPYTADDGDNPRPPDTSTHHRLEITESLVAAGADLDVRDERTYTPLMIAAATGQCDLVAALLAGHPDLSLKANTGETALAWARQEHPECVRFLLGTPASRAAAAAFLLHQPVPPHSPSARLRENREARTNLEREVAENDAAAKAQYRQLHPLGMFTGLAGSLFWSLILSTLLYAFHRVRSFIRGDKQPVHWSWVPVSSSSSTSFGESGGSSSTDEAPSRGGSSGGGGASRDF